MAGVITVMLRLCVETKLINLICIHWQKYGNDIIVTDCMSLMTFSLVRFSLTNLNLQGYDISFLVTNFHTEQMYKHKLVDFVIHVSITYFPPPACMWYIRTTYTYIRHVVLKRELVLECKNTISWNSNIEKLGTLCRHFSLNTTFLQRLCWWSFVRMYIMELLRLV